MRQGLDFLSVRLCEQLCLSARGFLLKANDVLKCLQCPIIFQFLTNHCKSNAFKNR